MLIPLTQSAKWYTGEDGQGTGPRTKGALYFDVRVFRIFVSSTVGKREDTNLFRLLATIVISAIGNLAAADLTSSWAGKMPAGGSDTRILLTLIENEGSVTGWLVSGDDTQPVAIENPRVQGDDVTFGVHDGAGRLTNFHLSLDGGALKGDAKSGDEVSKVALPRALYRAGNGVSTPVLVRRTNPEYPDAEREAKHQGTVTLQAEITPNGMATNFKVLHGINPILDEKAIECVKQWRFTPGQKSGIPVTVAATIGVNFQ